MEVENKDGSENTVPNGSTHPPKRGRGRPRGSPNKKFTSGKSPTYNARASKKVDFFSPEAIIKSKVKKRGRPKKLKIRGRPRKVPLTAEEESERLYRLSVQRKRKLSKPLGRPRIHPIVEAPRIKRGRGRPRKYEAMAESPSHNDTDSGDKEYPSSIEITLDVANGNPRKRGRPLGSNKKKRGRPSGSDNVSSNRVSDGPPRKRGRPPGSGSKVKNIKRVDGSPRKRGRPPGSPNKVKIIRREAEGSPRKRGRPPGSRNKVTVTEKNVGGAPQKRGRPPTTGKIKVCVPDEVDLDLDNFECTGAHRRKRGRPSKVRLAVVLEKLPSSYTDKKMNVPSPKRFCDSDSPSQSPNENREEDPTASENNAEEEIDNTIDCPKVNNVSEPETGEETTRVGTGKSKKKK